MRKAIGTGWMTMRGCGWAACACIAGLSGLLSTPALAAEGANVAQGVSVELAPEVKVWGLVCVEWK